MLENIQHKQRWKISFQLRQCLFLKTHELFHFQIPRSHKYARTYIYLFTTYLFIYVLFNDTVSSSDYIASNDVMING
jgi:hypothetical protein